jgi:protein-S-isoprenylcysteine O-methyltransferase Ste14
VHLAGDFRKPPLRLGVIAAHEEAVIQGDLGNDRPRAREKFTPPEAQLVQLGVVQVEDFKEWALENRPECQSIGWRGAMKTFPACQSHLMLLAVLSSRKMKWGLVMGRLLRFSFGLLAYVLFFASFLYLIGFVGNVFVPRSIDVGPTTSAALAATINLALILLFGVQHSVMARPGFKAALIRIWPAAIERSLYVALTAVALCVLYCFWRPLPAAVWSVDSVTLRTLLHVLCALGWAIVLISTFLINHFELFGLRQIWADMRGASIPETKFRQPLFYKLVRHPIYTGFLLAFWATPDMSQGHLLFAIAMTAYILVGIRYEEQDLMEILGADYGDYRQRVGMLIPGVGKQP